MVLIKRINSTLIVNIFIALAILLVIGSIIASNNANITNSQFVISFFKDPIVLSIAGGILTFLLVDRWRRVEGEISDIRQNQLSAIKDIREDAKSFTQDNVDAAARKAQAIEERVSSLLEDHPWIADITESEFIPDASSCKIILRTAEDLLSKHKVSLVYEYLFGWTRHRDKKPPIEGTADDFLDLAEFCERVLQDEYLGLLIVKEGVSNASDNTLLIPDYLKRLTRHGRFSDAERTYKQLKSSIDPNWYTKLIDLIQKKRTYQGSRYINRGYMALALHDAISGDKTKSLEYLQRAQKISSKIGMSDTVSCIEAEVHIIFGDFEDAQVITEKIFNKPSSSDDAMFELARILRSLGDIEKADELMEQFIISYHRDREDSNDLQNEKLNELDNFQKPKEKDPEQDGMDLHTIEPNIKVEEKNINNDKEVSKNS